MSIKETLTRIDVSRRSFFKLAATAGAAAAIPIGGGLKPLAANAEEVKSQSAGKWVASPCYHNCGGFCVNKAYVVNGTIIRQKTDDAHPDSPDNPQWRGCAKGRSQRKTVIGVDRLKYPMKRKHWSPGGGDTSLRGRDEWVRISWDEALDIVAGEYKRIKENYGNKSILFCTLGYPVTRVLAAYGGAMQIWGGNSTGGWTSAIPCMIGYNPMGVYPRGTDQMMNDRMDLRRSKLIVLWAGNPAWVAHGIPSYALLAAKKAGAKIIVVDPFHNATAVALADQWIPVRPSTDTALLLGIAHYIITNNLQDQAFLDRCTVGFDAEHMSPGHEHEENFKDYVLGVYDGQPKTAEWASEICGTDVAVIKAFAHEIATTKPMTFSSGFAPARTYNGEQFCQAFFTVGWMTGNVGKPGSAVGACSAYGAFNFGTRIVQYGPDGMPPIKNALFPSPTHWHVDPQKTDWFGPTTDTAWQSVLNGEFHGGVRGKVPMDIKMIDHTGFGNTLNQASDIFKGIEAHRQVEFVAASDLVPTPSVQFADVILPIVHTWEREGGHTGLGMHCHREMLMWGAQVFAPKFEARDTDFIDRELARRLDIDPDSIVPFNIMQQTFNKLAGATVMKEDGKTYETLVTITEEDLAHYGVEGKPQQGRISLRELQEKGYYSVPRREGDNYYFIAFKDFVENPQENPLSTESGKFEICCPKLAGMVKDHGFTTISAIAKYEPRKYGYEESKTSAYPLQFITPHYVRRAHSTMDSNPWLREAFAQELFMNADDARKRSIKDGDTVRIYNQYGSVLRVVKVTQRMIPGTIALGEGAWLNYDEKSGHDRAGSTNALCSANPSGVGVQSWNTQLAEVEKHRDVLPPDYLVAPKVLGNNK